MSKGTTGGTPLRAADTPAEDAGEHGSGDAAPPSSGRILRVLLSGDDRQHRSSILARDVDQAMIDLAADNSFQPRGLAGPFVLRLALIGGRLVFDIRDVDDEPLTLVGLALGPFRRLMKDYLMIVESHAAAAAAAEHPSRLEAIDMGRRGLHNEGAELIIQRLRGKIEVDFETARQLFTLVCVLHQRF